VRANARPMLVHDIKELSAHVASASAPAMSFHEIAPAGRSPMHPPRFILGPVAAHNLQDIFSHTATPAAGCYTIQGSHVAPTGFPVRDGVAFHAEAFLHPRHLVVAISDRLNAESPPVRDVAGPLAVICGPAHETWGHWLIDFLPRLWVLHQSGHDLARLRYLVPADLRPFAADLLRLCGIRDDQLVAYDHWRETIRTDVLLLPTSLRQGNRLAPCFTSATQFWTARARQEAGVAAHTGAGDQIYLTRDASPQGRMLQNRGPVAAVAAAAGLRAVHPETMSVAEQIALFSRATLFAGEYGSGLHNSVFAPPGARVVALRGTARHPDFIQSGLSTALAQDLGYVFGPTAGAEDSQSFSIDPNLFQLALHLANLNG
jgi:capsular polysaccharide biosynthesis protein